MNDYSIGAMEALSWAKAKLKECATIRDFRKAREEILETLDRLSSGAAVNFRDKVREIPEI